MNVCSSFLLYFTIAEFYFVKFDIVLLLLDNLMAGLCVKSEILLKLRILCFGARVFFEVRYLTSGPFEVQVELQSSKEPPDSSEPPT